MKEIRQTIKKILRVYHSDLDWETKFDVIFSPTLSRELNRLLNQYNLSVDWIDYDTSCQEDVTEYVKGVTDLIPTIDMLEKALQNDSSQQ
jgi:hypothetical protein